MKQVFAVFGLSVALLFSGVAFAGSQQEKMKGCNVEAKEQNLKGDDRKAFMSKCLKKDYVLKADAGKPADGGKADAAKAKVDDKKAKVEEKKTKADKKPEAAKAEEKPKATQQDKMKTCNAEAKSKSLAGEERKKFMSTCLKG